MGAAASAGLAQVGGREGESTSGAAMGLFLDSVSALVPNRCIVCSL